MDETYDSEEGTGIKLTPKRSGSIRKQSYFANLRTQLNDQLKSLDTRLETQVLLTTELQDYFKKRGEIEAEYSKSLDKLNKSLGARQKELKSKRDSVSLYTLFNLLEVLISETKTEANDHLSQAEIFNNLISSRFGLITEDLQRIYKQCYFIGTTSHEELFNQLYELYNSMKSYHANQTEFNQASLKLKHVQEQKVKLETGLTPEKILKSKKIKVVNKEHEKKAGKYNEIQLKTWKAKNDYLLCINSTNSSIMKYFVEDIMDIIDCMDLGIYESVSSTLNIYTSSREFLIKSQEKLNENLAKSLNSLDSKYDKQKFLELNNSLYVMPKKLEFVPLTGKGESNSELTQNITPELECNEALLSDLEQRIQTLTKKLQSYKIESDELIKTLETVEISLLKLINAKPDISLYFGSNSTKDFESLRTRPESRVEIDEFYLEKFHNYLIHNNRVVRLISKYNQLKIIVEEYFQRTRGTTPRFTSLVPVKRKRVGQYRGTPPRLFGGSLEEYVERSGEEIPLIIRSCIRVINLYGLHHQGIFRISGSQVEINNIRDSFERVGENTNADPLAHVNDSSDINNVAGVLKLYLRELREPIFPIVYFEQLLDLTQLEPKTFIQKISELIKTLPRSVYVVLRYLFGFLHHLSEYSEENMMDPYNIAICFGPTLIPIPDDKDQVQYQNLVNELLKNIIVYSNDIFPNDGVGMVYDKYMNQDSTGEIVGECYVEPEQESTQESTPGSENDSTSRSALALYDFHSRSPRELSFKKGDRIYLFNKVSSDWWNGSLDGSISGLIPHQYISVRDGLDDDDDERNHSIDAGIESLSSLSTNEDNGSIDNYHETESNKGANGHGDDDLHNNEVFLGSNEKLNQSKNEKCVNNYHSPPEKVPAPLESVSEMPEKQNGKHDPEMMDSLIDSHSITSTGSGSSGSETDSSNSSESDITEQFVGTPIQSSKTSACRSGSSTSANYTPDLVLNLPKTLSSQDNNNDSVESPIDEGSTSTTAAEVFAKQNQCTLKKKEARAAKEIASAAVASGSCSSSTPHIVSKPPVKLKPVVLMKPKVPSQLLGEESEDKNQSTEM